MASAIETSAHRLTWSENNLKDTQFGDWSQIEFRLTSSRGLHCSHINTTVGLRFNSALQARNSCHYLISTEKSTKQLFTK